MKKGNGSKKTSSSDSGLNFEAQFWAAAEQVVPAAQSEELKSLRDALQPKLLSGELRVPDFKEVQVG